MLQISEPDTLELLDFKEGIEDCCEAIEGQDDHQCDSPAEFKVAVTCDAHHTRTLLACFRHTMVAKEDSMACIACDKVGVCNLAIVLAVAEIKK